MSSQNLIDIVGGGELIFRRLCTRQSLGSSQIRLGEHTIHGFAQRQAVMGET